MPTASKTQRWIDLIAALLARRFPAPFEVLAKSVPAYQDPSRQLSARMRMFERDKDELRKLGVLIETDGGQKGGSAYSLKSREFFLPSVGVKKPSASRSAVRTPSVIFEPDELAMIARAAGRVQAMDHPILSTDANAAIRKIAFDVPFLDRGTRELILLPSGAQDPGVLDALDDALRRRKFVTFDYHSIGRDAHQRRKVAPYGLAFLRGHWYLWAHDTVKKALRQFRVSRITKPTVNTKNAQTADFDVPPDFNLWEQSERREAWELGDDDAIDVVVQFDTSDGHAADGALLGTAVRDNKNARRFVVRRPNTFVRWLLAFGGAARPVSPPSIVKMWRDLARQTSAHYKTAGAKEART